MIDSKTLRYEPFYDDRRDYYPGFDEGFSGAKYLATDQSGKKYLVKHVDASNAAHEFIGCWLAGKIGILAPKAYLLTPNGIFRTPYAVAIEWLDGLSPLSDSSYDYYEMAPIYALGSLMNNDDTLQCRGLNGHIVPFDFSESFSMSSMNLYLYSCSQNPSFAMHLIKSFYEAYCHHLEISSFDYSRDAEFYYLDAEKFNWLAVQTAKKVLEIPEKEYAAVLKELSRIYPKRIVRYYANCMVAMKEKAGKL